MKLLKLLSLFVILISSLVACDNKPDIIPPEDVVNDTLPTGTWILPTLSYVNFSSYNAYCYGG